VVGVLAVEVLQAEGLAVVAEVAGRMVKVSGSAMPVRTNRNCKSMVAVKMKNFL
jgi:malonyl CoA-acyl carrier protein transacylase